MGRIHKKRTKRIIKSLVALLWKSNYTLEELEKFNELIDKDSDKIMEIAVAGYICGITSQALIIAMRENKLEELFNSLPNLKEIKDEEFLNVHTEIKNNLTKTINTNGHNDYNKSIKKSTQKK